MTTDCGLSSNDSDVFIVIFIDHVVGFSYIEFICKFFQCNRTSIDISLGF